MLLVSHGLVSRGDFFSLVLIGQFVAPDVKTPSLVTSATSADYTLENRAFMLLFAVREETWRKLQSRRKRIDNDNHPLASGLWPLASGH